MALLVFLLALLTARGEPVPEPKPAPGAVASADVISPELEAALKGLKLPGVTINLAERSVDVESEVCLRDGMLELIACIKDGKEHESIIVVGAKPSHIHTALLLLGAKPGSPASRRMIDEEERRFIDLPPRGGLVDVFLVLKDTNGKKTEHPISDFIVPSERSDDGKDEDEKFPTHTFLFAGSILLGEGQGPSRYLCDQSGNVISIATFGDELLCLPDVHSNDNGALAWRVDGEKLPALGSKVILRLRPQVELRTVPENVDPTDKQ